jgi:hypothetical protein
MLLLLEGQMGETWEPSKITAVSEIGEHGIKKTFLFFKGVRIRDLKCRRETGYIY